MNHLPLRQFILLLSFLFVTDTCVVHAQSIRLSQKYTTQAVADPSFNSYLLNDYYYVVQDKFNMKSPINRDIQMDVFDNKGEFVSSTGIIDASLKMNEANLYVGLLPLSDKMALFKSRYVKEGDTKRSDLYVFTYSNFTQRDDGKKIATTSAESGTNAGNFYVASSPDGSKIAVLMQHSFIKGTRESCTVMVFDNAFKELWNKKYEFPFDNSKVPANTIWVNNNGSVFDLKNVDNKTENPYQSIIVFASNGSVIKENRLKMGTEGKISTMKTIFNMQGDLIMAGLYYNDKKFGINVENPKGTFYMKINGSDGSIAVTGSTPKEFAWNSKTVSLNLLSNDEVIVTAEQQEIKSTSIPDKPFEYNYEYINGNIYVTKINAKGDAEWQHIAKREVKSTNDGGKSNGVFTGIINGNISLVYRDLYYKYDGQQHAAIGFVSMKYIDVHRSLGMDGTLKSDGYIKRLGNDDSKEAVVIYLVPTTGKQQDEKNVLFMGCSEKILYGVKISF